MIRRERSRGTPPTPNTLADLTIEGEWACTNQDGERFMIYDNGVDAASRIIIFGSRIALEKLASATTWFMDGNFAMAPQPGFLQMYIIRVPIGTTAITTVFALLQSKSQNAYEELFQAIIDYCESIDLFLAPTTVLCDFELAVIRAVSDVFGNDVTI